MSVTLWCGEHYPKQYRNGLPAQCDACGFDRDGRGWIFAPEEGRAVVAGLAPGVGATPDDLRDLPIASKVLLERTKAWIKVIERES